mmetsp:Transcript_92847/g.233418  ORF Transcript_92847/g.233418 Transcript_92847/m.233418 type:complete len:315 (+) Transcript_92847:1297-2241(+)
MVAVQDGDGLGDGGFLVQSEHLALLELLGLRAAHVREVRQEFFVVCLLLDCVSELPLLRAEVEVVGAKCSLLRVVGALERRVFGLLVLDELAVRLDGRCLRRLGRGEVGLEGLLHALQDPNDPARLGHVIPSEGRLRLQKGLHRLALPWRQECVRGDQRLLHGVLQLQEGGIGLVAGHELRVVRRRLEGLVRTNGCQGADRLLQLVDRSRQVRLFRLESNLLGLAEAVGSLLGQFVVGHFGLELRAFCAEQAVRGLQASDLALEQADLRSERLDGCFLLGLVVVAIALVRRVQLALVVSLLLGVREHVLEELHD